MQPWQGWMFAPCSVAQAQHEAGRSRGGSDRSRTCNLQRGFRRSAVTYAAVVGDFQMVKVRRFMRSFTPAVRCKIALRTRRALCSLHAGIKLNFVHRHFYSVRR